MLSCKKEPKLVSTFCAIVMFNVPRSLDKALFSVYLHSIDLSILVSTNTNSLTSIPDVLASVIIGSSLAEDPD